MPKNTKQSAKGKKGIKAWMIKYHNGKWVVVNFTQREIKSERFFLERIGGELIPVLITPFPTPRRKGRVSKKK